MATEGNDWIVVDTDDSPKQRILQMKEKGGPSLDAILQRLGLKEHYPQKLGIQDVLKIRDSFANGKEPSCESEVPMYVLQRLICMDIRARTYTFVDKCPLRDLVIGDTEDSESFRSFFQGTNIRSVDDAKYVIHPSDILMAIYLCCDNMLRQYTMRTLAECQLAVPLIVPSYTGSKMLFNLWSLRSVHKTWRECNVSESFSMKDRQVVNESMLHVAFIRLGSSQMSKSQLMNYVVSKNNQTIFLHRNCERSCKTRVLQNGVIEICWYLPSARDTEVFGEPLCFLNLRGNALDLHKHVEFLNSICSVFVVVLPENSTGITNDEKAFLEKLFNSDMPMIYVCPDIHRDERFANSTKIKLAAQNKSAADLGSEVCKNIVKLLKLKCKKISLIDMKTTATGMGFGTDEADEECMTGKLLAVEVMQLLNSNAHVDIKRTYLPLQGALWKEWCDKNKQLTRREGFDERKYSSLQNYIGELEEEKKQIRRLQLSKAFPVNDLMKLTMNAACLEDETTKEYFLEWLRLELDAKTSKALPPLRDCYRKHWTEFCNKRKLNAPEEDIRVERDILKRVAEAITDASFGLDHCLREGAQLYEAVVEANPQPQDKLHTYKDFQLVQQLPLIAAKSLISGCKIELLDGNTSHVPISWISSVLEHAAQLLKNPRVFAVAVMGIQSTGKSTLLNALFGLKFPVSAGRCTRGAFMQLVPVEESLREKLNYDYLAVIDTEGLRAHDLLGPSQYQHDNELATFVIGLADVTIINILGENPTDIQDILQITVQAFLRMKQVSLSPCCHFVHQNVSAVDVYDSTISERIKLMEHLDNMSKMAASDCGRTETSFNEVISFDVSKHVWYFTNLLQGDPPMSSPNHGYLEQAQKLRQTILASAGHHQCSTLSGFKDKICDLWDALLHENFVFSFKNTLEITIWNFLETKYAEWAWELRRTGLQTDVMIRAKIEGLRNTSYEELAKDIVDKMRKAHGEVTDSMTNFFAKHENKDILIKWKTDTILRLQRTQDRLVDDSKERCKTLFQNKMKRDRIDECQYIFHKRIREASNKLASQSGDNYLLEDKLRAHFNILWEALVTELQLAHHVSKQENIYLYGMSILAEKYKAHQQTFFRRQSLFQEKVRVKSEPDTSTSQFANFVLDHAIHCIPKTAKGEIVSTGAIHRLTTLVKGIRRAVEHYLDKKQKQHADYNPQCFHEVLKLTHEHQLQKFEDREESFDLSTAFKIDTAIITLYEAAHVFEKLQREFEEANDPLRYLEAKKEQCYEMFETIYYNTSAAANIASQICYGVENTISDAVFENAAILIADEMRRTVGAFSSTKHNLEGHILWFLLEHDKFAAYTEYVKEPKMFMEDWIEDVTVRFLSQPGGERTSKLETILRNELSLLVKHVDDVMRNADTSMSVAEWLEAITEALATKNIGLHKYRLQEQEVLKLVNRLHSSGC